MRKHNNSLQDRNENFIINSCLFCPVFDGEIKVLRYKGVVMRNALVSRISKYTIAWLAAAAITLAAMAPSMPAKAASNEETAFFYLTDTLGFNVAAACGIMANIRHESNFHPGAGSWGGAYGLCQWMGGRLDGLEYYCWDHGFDPESMAGQLSYLTHELRSYYPSLYRYLMNLDNSSEAAYNAAYRFCYDFERPADRSGQSGSRGNLASGTYWNRYKIYAYDQWIETKLGTVYHYTDGTLHYGWLELDDERYYLDQDGILKKGLFSTEGDTYFSDEDGVLQYGWQEINGNKYYFDEETGKMQVGWSEVDGKMTFFDSNGKMTSVNSFNDKNNITDAEIASSVIEKEIEQEVTVNAPSADPLPLSDKLSDVAQTIQEAGSGSQSSAASVATPGKETQIDPDDYRPSSAVNGNTIDTSKLGVGDGGNEGVVMGEDPAMNNSGESKVVFEKPE